MSNIETNTQESVFPLASTSPRWKIYHDIAERMVVADRHQYPGRFIVLDGIDGAGKSTAARLLADRLKQCGGVEPLVLSDPGSTELGTKLRAMLKDVNQAGAIHPVVTMMLFLAARRQMVMEKIIPALEAGRTVICDRFTPSTIAYQGLANHLIQDLGRDNFCAQLRMGDAGLIPDHTFILLLDPVEARRRLPAVTNDFYDSKDHAYFQRIATAFNGTWMPLMAPGRTTYIEASAAIDTVVGRIFYSITQPRETCGNLP